MSFLSIIILCLFAGSPVKHTEMLDPTVHVWSRGQSGSGVIFYRDDRRSDKGIYLYTLVTNHHVVSNRKTKQLKAVDGLSGRSWFTIKDHGCWVTVFKDKTSEWESYKGKIIVESEEKDISIIVFETDIEICNIATLATVGMLDQIDVFDEIFAVGCQLGQKPIPTKGIVSQLIQDDNYLGLMSDAPIYLGSSGGGIFRKYDGHYYLIGILQKIGVGHDQLIPHIAYSISIKIVLDLMYENDLSYMVDGVSLP